MKYFTPERYLALQNFEEEAMNAADADWEAAADRYDAYLLTIRPELSESVRQLLDGFYLHDAKVLSMGRRSDTFFVVLQLDVPPNELLTITYTLAGPPEIISEVFPPDTPSARPEWLYEELELVCVGTQRHYVHSILFSNGWEVRLPFRDVQMMTAYPLFPIPRSQADTNNPVLTSPLT